MSDDTNTPEGGDGQAGEGVKAPLFADPRITAEKNLIQLKEPFYVAGVGYHAAGYYEVSAFRNIVLPSSTIIHKGKTADAIRKGVKETEGSEQTMTHTEAAQSLGLQT